MKILQLFSKKILVNVSEIHVKKVCSSCSHELGDQDVYYSDATCPYCGETKEGTITRYEKLIGRTFKFYKPFSLFPYKTEFTEDKE